MKPEPIVVDFETDAIEPRPSYPPRPVGVSIKLPGSNARYFAFGHESENNCTKEDARRELFRIWKDDYDGLLFQNGKFDVDVAETFFKMPRLHWASYHDTMFHLFLDDPHQTSLSLKPSAERILGMKPAERDAVADWLIEKQPVRGVKISRSPESDHYFMKYIRYAPGSLVAEYANGDVIRTEKLFEKLHKSNGKRGMLEAYDRERRLMPILLDMERRGVSVDLKRLHNDVMMYGGIQLKIDRWIRSQLRNTRANLDSGPQLVEAMIKAGKVEPELLPRTPTGKYQTNKEALILGITDKYLLAVLKYRAQLKTCMSTFMLPWLETAEASNGLIYTTWNQVKTPQGDSNVGTRTGRLSSTPNFQNIPKEFAPIFYHEAPKLKLPKCPISGLLPLPMIRSYITPFKGEVLVDRDYSQQELRILAHFDGGALLRRYQEDNWMDVHEYAQKELAKMGLRYDRKPVKNTNFGLLYGMGVGKLAMKNNMAVDEAAMLKKAVLSLYPGLKAMYQEMRRRAEAHEPIRTWGGREYYCEEPQVKNGRIQKYDYKLVNVLIQGSAADCTKEAIIRFNDVRDSSWKMILSVHDEEMVSAPKRQLKPVMEMLRSTMESVEFDLPMLSEGSISSTNWNELKDYDKKGELCSKN
jgi:DNA polymerase I-like protein with 3'-5' exonuclease and polymerase domains